MEFSWLKSIIEKVTFNVDTSGSSKFVFKQKNVDKSKGKHIVTNINERPDRRLITSHVEDMVVRLEALDPLEHTIYIQSGDSEVRRLADEIDRTLVAGGWTTNGIQTMLGGYIPDGVIVYRDKESDSSLALLEELVKAGLYVEGQKEFKYRGVRIYVGQNPDKYNG